MAVFVVHNHGQSMMLHLNAFRERDKVGVADALWEEWG
jgi:hypothetical protein